MKISEIIFFSNTGFFGVQSIPTRPVIDLHGTKTTILGLISDRIQVLAKSLTKLHQ
jgi:hypothetical protein